MMTNHNTTGQFWAVLRRRGALALCLGLLMVGLSLSESAKAANYITIDAPAASPGSTTLYYNNALGTIVGAYQDGNSSWHGFLRTLDGHYTIIDAPGAGTTAYRGTGGPGLNLNDFGAVAGTYSDPTGARHGFLRTPDGHYTAIDLPGVGVWTWISAINNDGMIAGMYSGWHDFLRARNGTITTIDAPGGNSGGHGAQVWGDANLTPSGAFLGFYYDLNGAAVTFLRSPNGTETTIRAPGAATGSGDGTIPSAINPEGTITGAYDDTNYVVHGFLRTARGNYITFDPPNSGYTIPQDINLLGAIVGYYYDANGVQHGFLRNCEGTYTTIDVPGATGTAPAGINWAGQIVGVYNDADGNQHGFLRIP